MIHFDTLHYAKTLQASGFSQKQSEALAEAQQEALSGCINTTFATKADIGDVRIEIADVRAEITDVRAEITDVRAEIASVRQELSEEIHGVKAEVIEIKGDIKVLTSRVNRLDWMLGLLLTGMASLVAKAFLA